MFLFIDKSPFPPEERVPKTISGTSSALIEHDPGNLQFELMPLPPAVVDIQKRSFKPGFGVTFFGGDSQIDLPVAGAGSAGIVGKKRWPTLCENREWAGQKNRKNNG